MVRKRARSQSQHRRTSRPVLVLEQPSLQLELEAPRLAPLAAPSWATTDETARSARPAGSIVICLDLCGDDDGSEG